MAEWQTVPFEDIYEEPSCNGLNRPKRVRGTGYEMAVMVEKRFGRPSLIETMLDPRRLLLLYNEAATEKNATTITKLPLWSEEVLKSVGAE